MTASPARRRRRTQIAAVVTGCLLVVSVVLVAVAAVTLRTSEEGEAVERDTRPVVTFPSTPNAAIAVVDEESRLSSLVVATLDPSGAGGSVAIVPTNVDTSSGFGSERLPLSRRPYEPGSEVDVEALMTELESVLSLTIERGIVLGPDELQQLVEPLGELTVDLPENVVDSDRLGTGIIQTEGETTLRTSEIVDVFTAIDAEGAAYDHHDVDVVMWNALAGAVSANPFDVDVPIDEFERPIPPTSAEDLVERLFGGPVGVREVDIDPAAAVGAPNPDDTDFVVVDRRDALLVFGQVSPALVSTPNQALAFQLVAPYTDEQLALAADGASSAEIMRQLIGELLFLQGNVVSVQTAPRAEGAPERTQIDVADERFLDDVESSTKVLFGPSDVVLADTILDGADVVVTLGTAYLELRNESVPDTVDDDE